MFFQNCSAQNTANGKTYALKQERPPNLWEYYICLEIVSRIPMRNIVSPLQQYRHAKLNNWIRISILLQLA